MKFKVGDKVRIIQNTSLHKFKIGELVEVLSNNVRGNDFYRLRSLPTGIQYEAYECDLELDEGKEKTLTEQAERITGIKNVELCPKSESAKRFNSGKVEFDTLPWVGIIEMAKVSQMGAAKYDKHNCKKEATSSQYFNCGMRHKLKHMLGEDSDLELKVFHLCQDAWNSLSEVEHILSGKLVDDRHKFENLDIEKLFSLNDDQQEVIKKVTDDKKEK